jgi:hypothetical protein
MNPVNIIEYFIQTGARFASMHVNMAQVHYRPKALNGRITVKDRFETSRGKMSRDRIRGI